MRICGAATKGAIDPRLVPKAIDGRHKLIASYPSNDRAEALGALRVEPVTLDLPDGRALRRVVLETRHGAIVHGAPVLAGLSACKYFERSFDQIPRQCPEGEAL